MFWIVQGNMTLTLKALLDDSPKLAHTSFVLLPVSYLQRLTSNTAQNDTGPWTFELINSSKTRRVYCSVLEFTSSEGTVGLPPWMMKHLKLRKNSHVHVNKVDLLKGKFMKIQPQHPDFLKIKDVRDTLERAIQSYPVITKDTTIPFTDTETGTTHELLIVSIDPGDSAISTIDSDLEVDFDTPKGYIAPVPPPLKSFAMDLHKYTFERPSFAPFSGTGNTLKGKEVVQEIRSTTPQALRLPPGMLFFGFDYKPYRPKTDV